MTLNYPTSIENVWSVENSNIACFCSGENIYEGFELKIKGKKQVLDAIKILEQREDILLAEPDYHITVEPGIDKVEPTATSTPSKVTSPEADDNNAIFWISVISGVVIVAAVVVIVTVKKKK